jgi:hypothetical protein
MSDESTTNTVEHPVIAYESIVRDGVIRLPFRLPDGVKVFIIVPSLPARTETGSAEWRKAIDEFEAYVRTHPARADIQELSDETLNAEIREVRKGAHAS